MPTRNFATSARTLFVGLAMSSGAACSDGEDDVIRGPLPQPAVETLAVVPPAPVLQVGEAVVLTPQVFTYPGASVTYVFTSTSPTVASVAPNGIVYALRPGRADITVTATGSGAGFATATRMATARVSVAGPPRITRVTPDSGSTAGGTTVTISGTGFVRGAVVTFGGTVATTLFQSETALTVEAPARAAGAATVSVTNVARLADSLLNGFTYVAPTIRHKE